MTNLKSGKYYEIDVAGEVSGSCPQFGQMKILNVMMVWAKVLATVSTVGVWTIKRVWNDTAYGKMGKWRRIGLAVDMMRKPWDFM